MGNTDDFYIKFNAQIARDKKLQKLILKIVVISIVCLFGLASVFGSVTSLGRQLADEKHRAQVKEQRLENLIDKQEDELLGMQIVLAEQTISISLLRKQVDEVYSVYPIGPVRDRAKGLRK